MIAQCVEQLEEHLNNFKLNVTRIVMSVMYSQIHYNRQRYVFCAMCMSVDKDAGIMASNIRCGVWSVE